MSGGRGKRLCSLARDGIETLSGPGDVVGKLPAHPRVPEMLEVIDGFLDRLVMGILETDRRGWG